MDKLPEVKAIALNVNGHRHVLAAPIGERDPMEVTLGEWLAAPALSGVALFNDFMNRRATPPKGETE